MALSGIHVACGFAGIDGFESSVPEIIKDVVWSESPASGVTSTNSAPNTGGSGSPVFRVDVSADAYVSVGPSPNASVSPRHFVRAGSPYDIGVKPGDKFQWVAA